MTAPAVGSREVEAEVEVQGGLAALAVMTVLVERADSTAAVAPVPEVGEEGLATAEGETATAGAGETATAAAAAAVMEVAAKMGAEELGVPAA